MKNLKLYIVIFLSISLLLGIDYFLNFYGRGFNIFNKKITYGYNTDYDPLEGFKIEEDEFEQIIGRATYINKSVKVLRVLEYSFDDNGIYCKIEDENHNILFVKIVYDNHRKPGYKIYYDIINESNIYYHLKWYNVDKPYFITIIEFIRLIVFGIVILTIIRLVRIRVIKKKQIRV